MTLACHVCEEPVEPARALRCDECAQTFCAECDASKRAVAPAASVSRNCVSRRLRTGFHRPAKFRAHARHPVVAPADGPAAAPATRSSSPAASSAASFSVHEAAPSAAAGVAAVAASPTQPLTPPVAVTAPPRPPSPSRPCDNCESAQAEVHCSECGWHLCGRQGNQCDEQLHAPRKKQAHVRTPLLAARVAVRGVAVSPPSTAGAHGGPAAGTASAPASPRSRRALSPEHAAVEAAVAHHTGAPRSEVDGGGEVAPGEGSGVPADVPPTSDPLGAAVCERCSERPATLFCRQCRRKLCAGSFSLARSLRVFLLSSR